MNNRHSPSSIVNHHPLIVLVATLIAALLAMPENLQCGDDLASRRTPVVIAVERAGRAVANISTKNTVLVRHYDDPSMEYRNRFFGGLLDDFFRSYSFTKEMIEAPLGSGAIIDDDGYIITNEHVASVASNLVVTLSDKSTYESRLVSVNAEKDLALLKIDPGKGSLHHIDLGRSDDLMLGETVIALGNPFGYENSVTTGVVSAVNREISVGDQRGSIAYKGLIQTSALINPGNSGGPLLNVNGKLIGINVAIRADAQGIGFAIPVDAVKEVLGDLFDYRHIARMWIGIEVEDRSPSGIITSSVEPNSPASKEGLRENDTIATVDGERIEGAWDFKRRVLKKNVGDVLRLGVLRGGRPKSFNVRVAELPPPSGRGLARKKLGLSTADLTRSLLRKYRLSRVVNSGVLVSGVDNSSPAARVIEPGDVIIRIESYRIRNLDDLGIVLEPTQSGQIIEVEAVRIDREDIIDRVLRLRVR